MDMIQKLYWGECYPAEKVKPTSPQYEAAKKAYDTALDALESQLTEEQKKCLDQFMDENANLAEQMYLEFFREGMRIGTQLYMEMTADK